MENKEVIEIDWKAPAEGKMLKLVMKLSDEEKKEFADKFTEEKEDKLVIKKTDAKKWVYKKFKDSDEVKWKNLPKEKPERETISDVLKAWKNL